MRNRTAARELALQALYQHDLRSRMESTAQISAGEVERFIDIAEEESEAKAYARWIVEGTLDAQAELDEQIVAVAQNWKLNRIAPVDRCILRLALFELRSSFDHGGGNPYEVPPKVAINEAIDLAKKYSTEQSGSFVNGILDKVYGSLEQQPEDRTANGE